jgi:hypothetical protein
LLSSGDFGIWLFDRSLIEILMDFDADEMTSRAIVILLKSGLEDF